jgi:mannosyltransferase OCH1-like enzyme
MNEIPKILHQIWLGGSEMPQEFIIWRNKWIELHPDWKYMLHTDDTIKDIPDYLKKYIDSCEKYSSKSNVLRLYVIFKYGGVYCDTDFEWNKNIDCFLNNKFIIAKQHGNLYCNAFFGSIANNEIIKYQLDLLQHYVNKSPPWGPTLMTVAVEKYIKNLTILPTKYIYPYMWFEPYKPAKEFNDAYLVHHWSKSWK